LNLNVIFTTLVVIINRLILFHSGGQIMRYIFLLVFTFFLLGQTMASSISIDSLYNLAKYHKANEEYSKSIENYLKIQNLTKKTIDDAESYKLNTQIADLYLKWGIYDRALHYYEHAKEYEAIDLGELAYINTQSAFLNDKLLNQLQAIEDYSTAYKYYKETNQLSIQASILNELSVLYMKNGQNENSLNSYYEIIELYKTINDQKNLFRSYNNIVILLMRNNALESSLKYANKALNLIEEIELTNDEKYAFYSLLGSINLSKSEISIASTNYKKALDIALLTKQSSTIVNSYNQLSYLSLASNIYNANKYASLALDEAQRVNDKLLIRDCYKMLSHIAKSNGDEHLALDYYENYVSLQDEIISDLMDEKEKLSKQQLRIANLEKTTALMYAEQEQNQLEIIKFNLENENLLKSFDLLASLNEQKELKLLKKSLQQANQIQELEIRINKKELDLQQDSIQILSIDNRNQVLEIENLELAEKENLLLLDLAKQEKQIAGIRNIFIISGLILLLITGLTFINRQRLKLKKNKIILLQNKELHQKKQQIMQLEIEKVKFEQNELKYNLKKQEKAKEKLIREQEFNHQQLSTYTLQRIKYNRTLLEIKEKLEDLLNNLNPKSIVDLISFISGEERCQKDWKNFEHYFSKTHPEFNSSLLTAFPKLTSNDIRLASLCKINLTIREISDILAISPGSVKVARNRLKKKLNLDPNQELTTFLINFNLKIKKKILKEQRSVA